MVCVSFVPHVWPDDVTPFLLIPLVLPILYYICTSTLQLWVDWGSNMYVAPTIGPGLSPHLYVGSLPVILPNLKGLGWLHSEHSGRCVHANWSCSPAQGYAKDNNGKTTTRHLVAHILPEVNSFLRNGSYIVSLF